VALVRGPAGRNRPSDGELAQYVNDRPYAASSMLAVALKEAFRTALTGRCDARPTLAQDKIPLEIHVPALRCRGGQDLARTFFEPLGWTVAAESQPLTPEEWGPSAYLDLRLTGEVRLADALNHLYVLLPVLDDAKHYWVSTDEVDKLVRAGRGWLAAHPERDLITGRYLAHQAGMQTAALARLAEVDDSPADAIDNAIDESQVAEEPERAQPLAELRISAVLDVLRDAGARSVADLGCGDGRLLAPLLDDATFTRIVGTDVSSRALELAARRLARMPERQRDRAELFQSSLVYRDARLTGFDAAVLMEVIEHVDPPRLTALARTVFGFAAPATVVVTTPNAEHNARYPGLAPGTFRHRDHRFEWTRPQFRDWAASVAATFGYTVWFLPVGPEDATAGPATQMAVFRRTDTGQADR